MNVMVTPSIFVTVTIVNAFIHVGSVSWNCLCATEESVADFNSGKRTFKLRFWEKNIDVYLANLQRFMFKVLIVVIYEMSVTIRVQMFG